MRRLIPLCLLLACSSPDASTATAIGPDPDFAGCQQACGYNDPYDEADLVPQPGANVGDLTRCPVSDAVFRVGPAQPQVEHAGVRYYVCCAGCADRFRDEPARFATPRG